MPELRSDNRDGPLFRFDPGWLFLVAGAALVSATVLIPAVDDLAQARWHRDRAVAVERYRAARLETHSAYLDALDRGDAAVLLALAQTQLNMTPVDGRPLVDLTQRGLSSASVFDGLEPTFVPAPKPARAGSILERWATDEQMRLWLMGLGGILVLVGLLPGAPVD